MEARDEIPQPVLTGSPGDLAGARGAPAGNLARSVRRGGPVRRGGLRQWGLWALLAVTVGAAAYNFVYVNRPATCYRRALKALGRDDFEGARYELLRLRGLPEYEPHACLINGILLLQGQKPDDALEEFRLALDHPDTRVLALTLWGRTLLQQRKFGAAELALHKALEYDPKLAEAHRLLGAAYFDIGDLHRSLAHLETAAKLSPGDPRPYQFMATIHRSFHQDELAIEDLRELLRRGPGPSPLSAGVRQDALLEIAQIQAQFLRHQEAIETLKEADDTADALALRADCQFHLGDLPHARDDIDRALQLDPDHFESLLLQGRLAMEANDVDSAVESLNRALELRPRSRQLHVILSQALHVLGQDDLAEQHSEKASQLGELSVEYAELCGVAMDEPRNTTTCYRLGLLAERLGLENEAAGWYRSVLMLEPKNDKARQRLLQLPGGLAGLGGEP